ncbi:MAG TPA: GNAT family N-acetyltransferase [Acidimicrobiales bacterium]|nr:GNAT family N-acetyltransferase [Acidimicrobiales bacterium]
MRVERLGDHHEVGNFSCGVKDLDDWLSVHALDNQRRDLSRTFLLLDDADRVVGYYALTMGGVRKEALPTRYGRGLPKFDIGMVLLARFAIADERQGQGLGRDLLIEAIERAADAGTHVAARFIAVDPIDEAARAFYAKFGFRLVEGDVEGRMYLRIDEALAALGGPS